MGETQPEPRPRPEDERPQSGGPNRREEFPEKPGPSATKVNRIINYVFVVLISLIFIRLLLKALGGNPGNAFVNFIYTLTEPLVMPFLTVFSVPVVSTSIGILELGSLVAIAFYVLLNYAIVKLIWIVSSHS